MLPGSPSVGCEVFKVVQPLDAPPGIFCVLRGWSPFPPVSNRVVSLTVERIEHVIPGLASPIQYARSISTPEFLYETGKVVHYSQPLRPNNQNGLSTPLHDGTSPGIYVFETKEEAFQVCQMLHMAASQIYLQKNTVQTEPSHEDQLLWDSFENIFPFDETPLFSPLDKQTTQSVDDFLEGL